MKRRQWSKEEKFKREIIRLTDSFSSKISAFLRPARALFFRATLRQYLQL